jgi:phosphate transport system regulatory protein phoU
MDLGGSPKMEGQKVTSRKYYEMELQKLNASLLEMGEMIRMAIGGAVTALLEFDHDKAREIIAYDEQIDRQNREIEQQCYTLLLSQQPVAGDLRMVSAALKMTTDMERIGDHAADISEIELMLENLPTLSCAPIRQMATETSVMLIKSLEAFAQRDEEKANWVIDRDDVVDDLFDTVKSELIEAIRQNADNGEAATDLLMAAKYFERIGDHATNIAQWAIFSITGEMPKD